MQNKNSNFVNQSIKLQFLDKLPEEGLVKQMPGNILNNGRVSSENSLGIDNLKKMEQIQ